MKRCTQCKVEKDSSAFYKQTKTKDGLYPHCKDCHNQRKSKYNSYYANKLKASITPENLAKKVYHQAIDRTKCSKHYLNLNISVDFSQDDLIEYIKNNWETIEPICLMWKEHGFQRKDCPSIDRIDPLKNYDIDNIRIITVSENCSRRRNGIVKKHQHHGEA